MLASLLIPITLSSLSLATPSLLLTLLESLLETRFTTIAQEVRSSWERKHRTEVTEFLVDAVAEVLDRSDVAEAHRMRAVEVSSVVKGREEGGIAILVDGLLRIAERMGLPLEQKEDEERSTIAPEDSRAPTPTPQHPRREAPLPSQLPPSTPLATSTPPYRSHSSLSTSSRVSLRHVVAVSPPLTSQHQPTPVTPRSTLRLQGLANALASSAPRRDRPPLFVPPAMATGSQDDVVRPVPRRGVTRVEVDDLFSSRVLESQSGGEQGNTHSEEVQGVSHRRRKKGKGVAKEEVCECRVSVVDDGEEADRCTCTEHVHSSSPPTHHKGRSRPSRRPFQTPIYESSASDDPPAPVPTRTIPVVSPRPRERHPRSQSAAPHYRQFPSSTSAPSRPVVQIHHARSGYLSVVGESEIEAFERSQKIKKKGRSKSADLGAQENPRIGAEEGEGELKLVPPDGWGWVRIEDEGLAGLSSFHHSHLDHSPPRRPNKSSTNPAPETPSPYTLLLLSQRARLAEKLRDLKMGKMEQERGRPFLDETTEAEEDDEAERKGRVVVRRRVERVGKGWWKDDERLQK